MDDANVQKVRNFHELCQEPETVKNIGVNSKSSHADIQKQFSCWFVGFLISFMPVFGMAIYHLIIGKRLVEVFVIEFCSSEIMFISVSTAVTAMYDFFVAEKRFSWSYILIIVFSSILYTIFFILNDSSPESYNVRMVIALNVIFLAVVFTRRIAQFLQEYRRSI